MGGAYALRFSNNTYSSILVIVALPNHPAHSVAISEPSLYAVEKQLYQDDIINDGICIKLWL